MPFTLATYRSTAQGRTSAGPRTFLGQTEGNTRYEDQQQQQQQQLSLACLLSSGCQCQRVPFESFIPASLLEAHHHAGRRILPRGYPLALDSHSHSHSYSRFPIPIPGATSGAPLVQIAGI